MAEVCNARCSTKVKHSDRNRCGGLLFGTKGHAWGCGRFFCSQHMLGKGAPLYCAPCWRWRRQCLDKKSGK